MWIPSDVATATAASAPRGEKSASQAIHVPPIAVVTRPSTSGATARTQRLKQRATSTVGAALTASQSLAIPPGVTAERTGTTTPPNLNSGMSGIDGATTT